MVQRSAAGRSASDENVPSLTSQEILRQRAVEANVIVISPESSPGHSMSSDNNFSPNQTESSAIGTSSLKRPLNDFTTNGKRLKVAGNKAAENKAAENVRILKETNENLRIENKKLKAEIQKMKSNEEKQLKATGEKIKIAVLQHVNAKISCIKEQANQKVVHLKSNIKNLETELDNRTTEKGLLQTELDNRTTEGATLKILMSSNLQLLHESESKLNQSHRVRQDLMQEVKSAKLVIEAQIASLNDQSAKIDKLRSEIDQYDKVIQYLRETNDRLHAAYAPLHTWSQNLCTENANCVAIIKQMEDKNSMLEAELRNKQRNNVDKLPKQGNIVANPFNKPNNSFQSIGGYQSVVCQVPNFSYGQKVSQPPYQQATATANAVNSSRLNVSTNNQQHFLRPPPP